MACLGFRSVIPVILDAREIEKVTSVFIGVEKAAKAFFP